MSEELPAGYVMINHVQAEAGGLPPGYQMLPRQSDQFDRYPNPEAARRASKIGIVGKVLGAAGLDASGERAKTSWSEAIGNTVAGQSLLNQAYDIGHAAVHAGDSPEAMQNAAFQIYPLLAGVGKGPLVRPSEIAPNGSSRGTGSQLATQRASAMTEDAQAFRDLNVRPFAPAFAQGPVAATAKQLSEVPIIGAPIKNALDDSLMGARDAALRLADSYSPATTFDQAGATLQRGLERFRTAGVKDLEPGILSERGIEPRAPIQPPDIMSAGAVQARATATPIRDAAGGGTAQTTRGANVPAARSRQQVLIARRTAEDLSDAELRAVVRSPANETSFAARQEALYEEAWRSLPTQMRQDGSRNPQLVNAVNTRSALGIIEGNIANQIAGQGTITGALAQRLSDARSSNFTLQSLRAIRTELGRQLSDFNPVQTSLNRTQLKMLYGSLSRDIEVGIQTLSDRAYISTQNPPGTPQHVPLSVARQADAALYRMKVADRYTRQGMDRIDNFMKVVNADKPEAAAKRLVQAAMDGGRGDISMLRAARSALRNNEWNDFSGLVMRELGRPVASARGTPQELGFSVQSFLTRYNNLDPRAREMLFGQERAQQVEQLVRVISRLANVEAMANTSRSASNGLTLTGLAAGGASILSGNVALPAAMVGGGLSLSLLFSRPELVRWATGYANARAAMLRAPNTAQARTALSAYLSSMLAMAKIRPELMPLYQAFSVENGQGGES